MITPQAEHQMAPACLPLLLSPLACSSFQVLLQSLARLINRPHGEFGTFQFVCATLTVYLGAFLLHSPQI